MGLLANYIKFAGEYYPRIRLATGMVAFSVALGVIGFILIEGLSLLDAFYMTVITISTVGFAEVQPLSDAGRLFTIFLIITNIGIFTYAVTIVGSFLIEGQFRNVFKKVKLEQEVAKLTNHTIVCGYGRNGFQACEELADHKQPFIVIENNPDRIAQLKLKEHFLVIEGDATQDEVLISAGIQPWWCKR